MKVGDIITLPAADTSLTAYRIVEVTSAGYVEMIETITTAIIGVTNNNASATGQAVGVIINGTAKVICNASIPAGSIIGAASASNGKATVGTTTSAILGVALESGSTNSIIEITVQPRVL